MVIQVEGISTKQDADKLKGKKVIWTSPAGKKLEGKISKAHGSKGAVLVRFEKGLPGQAIGTEVSIE